MAKRRTLAPDERALWQAVAQSTRPLPGRALADAAEHASIVPPLPADPPPPPQWQTAAIPHFRIGEANRKPHAQIDILPPLSERLAEAPLRMDARAFRQMTRGRLSPEASIDLHGLTLVVAHPELIRFVLNAQSAGARLVLVITGKGKPGDDSGPIPRRTGALRHQVPLWLRQPPLAAAVLQVAEAHLRHGGSGALYVYLRRLRA